MRAIICAAIMLSFSGVISAADDDKIDAKKLIGKWEEVTKQKPVVVVEFAEKSKLTLYLIDGDKTTNFKGSYQINSNKLDIEIPEFKIFDKGFKDSCTISKLSDEELVWRWVGNGGDKKFKKLESKNHLGQWEWTKAKDAVGATDKMVFEFAEKGKLTLHQTVGAETKKFEGTYKLTGTELVIALPDTSFGKWEETITISRLTDDEMDWKDSKSNEYTWTKVKPKK